MKIKQLIEYNVKNIIPEKSYTKCGREGNPRPFYKKSMLGVSVDQQFETLYSFFLLYAPVKVYQNILKLR